MDKIKIRMRLMRSSWSDGDSEGRGEVAGDVGGGNGGCGRRGG